MVTPWETIFPFLIVFAIEGHSSSSSSSAVVMATNETATGCFSCAYRGFLFPRDGCRVDEGCDESMSCYKITAFVPAKKVGVATKPWIAHSCAQPAAIENIRKKREECDVVKAVIQKLDPEGARSLPDTFNRCALVTCENRRLASHPFSPCNDDTLPPLWCWEYAIEIDDAIIRDSSKEFHSESDYIRAKRNWLQNQRNATKCSERGLDTCLSLRGTFRGRKWSLQTCADSEAIKDLIERKESCSYLEETMSNGKMGTNVIKLNDGAPATPPSATDAPECLVRTCDTNGCNAQVPFFLLSGETTASLPPGGGSSPHDRTIVSTPPSTPLVSNSPSASTGRYSSVALGITAAPSSSSSSSRPSIHVVLSSLGFLVSAFYFFY